MDSNAILAFFILCMSSLFTIMNPFSTASIFLSMTKDYTKDDRKEVAKIATLTAASILIIFALLGNFIMSFFGITIEAFRISGGILVIIVGLTMINPTRIARKKSKVTSREDIAIIPLAIPMLSGPGAMTTSIVLMSKVSGVTMFFFLVLAILLVAVISYFILSRANIIHKYIRRSEQKIINQIMGLIVLVVGVQFLIDGIHDVLHLWSIV